ncbi:MAG: DUF6069 family protein [Dermatophilaceae bacterium]
MTTTTGSSTISRRALAVGGGAVAGLLVWVLLVPIGGMVLRANSGDAAREIPVVAVLISSVIGGLVGWGIAEVLQRRVGRPKRTWVRLTTVLTAVSCISPFGGAADTSSALGLVLMHLGVALVVIPGIAATLPAARAATTTG